jgi:hypothetical protein
MPLAQPYMEFFYDETDLDECCNHKRADSCRGTGNRCPGERGGNG